MVIKYSGRLCHMSSVACEVGQELKKGDKIGIAGNTGISYGRHVDVIFVQGESHYPSHSKVERCELTVDLDGLDKWTGDDLFKTDTTITTTYLEEGYKEKYANGLYEHHGKDVVPTNGDDWTLYACEDCVVLLTGYNDSVGYYVVVGVEEGDDLTYKDVSEDRWSYDYIERATELGIVNGVSDDIFDPEGDITREQCVAMVMRMYDALNK